MGDIALTMQVFFEEVQDFLHTLLADVALFEFLEIGKGSRLQAHQQTSKQLFVGYSVFLQTIGRNIVDSLHENYVCIDVIEVFDQCTMATGAEE